MARRQFREGEPRVIRTKSHSTPMLEQYWRLKQQQPDALLFFRLGDFYELFEEDAQVAAPLLDLQLTSRDGKVPMCGVPYHAGNQHARRLLERGYTVAIAEQVEDPAQARGLVERKIVRVLTPGTVIPEDDERSPRLGVLYRYRNGLVALVAEVSTGTLHVVEGRNRREDIEHIAQLWSGWQPNEYLSNLNEDWGQGARVEAGAFFVRSTPSQTEQIIQKKLGLASLRRWGLDTPGPVHEALAALARYLKTLGPSTLGHLRDIHVHALEAQMRIGARALAQLDITSGAHSLLRQVDRCRTNMGSRRLQDWLEHPLADAERIQKRSQAVGYWVDNPLARDQLRTQLAQAGDMSRRLARLVMGVGRPRDLKGLVEALKAFPALWECAHLSKVWPGSPILERQPWATLTPRLDVLSDPVPARWEDTPLVASGVDAEIDRYRVLINDQRQALTNLEDAERRRSGIKSLRVGYHRTFGYYIEVTKSQAGHVPEDWHRRQTTTHTERFVSDSLRELETAILEAEDQLKVLERRWAERLVDEVTAESEWLAEAAAWAAELDALASLSEAAVAHRYCPPELDEPDAGIVVGGLRHPVIERLVDEYVASNLALESPHHALVITGPNMGGKSTFMRALAQNVILAQIGGWVACEKYRAPVFDSVLTRMGADDDLARGQSTFMVEMEEVAAILHQATPRSLVLLDELGRGTSTYDGLAIAHAVVERLAVPDGPLTLFATHYHELTSLADGHAHMANLTVEVLDGPHGPIFTHRVVSGAASQSYGLEVARLAGLPPGLVRRAERHLARWEEGHFDFPSQVERGEQITFEAPDPLAKSLLDALKSMNPDDLSPREAWLWIAEWYDRVRRGGI